MMLDRRRFLLGAGAAALLPGRLLAEEKADVLVVGAGLAGLNAALLLADQGAKVIVLEGDTRVGGRVRTLDDAPGRPDAGGSEVGPLYARTRSRIAELGLSLYRRRPLPPGMAIHHDGRLIAPAAWASDRANRLPPALRPLPPYALEGALLAKAKPLPDATAWLEPEAAARDGRYDTLLAALGADAAALGMITVGGQTDRLGDMSALWMLRRDQSRRQSAGEGPVEFLSGGMSALPRAMAAKLGDRVRLGAVVEAIRQDARGVAVDTRDGRRFAAARAIVTTPATIIRRLRFDPAPPPALAAAWSRIPYGQATALFFPVTGRFWEEDGLPPSTWSGTMSGRAFIVPNEVGDYLWFYATGARAARLHRLPIPQAAAAARAELIAARPSLAGRLGPGSGLSWTRHPFSHGTFAARHPGGLAALQAALKRPHGRIHFAGEHSADLTSGIEGALDSGERAALELIV